MSITNQIGRIGGLDRHSLRKAQIVTCEEFRKTKSAECRDGNCLRRGATLSDCGQDCGGQNTRFQQGSPGFKYESATNSTAITSKHENPTDFNKPWNLVRDQGVGGSNPLSPTNAKLAPRSAFTCSQRARGMDSRRPMHGPARRQVYTDPPLVQGSISPTDRDGSRLAVTVNESLGIPARGRTMGRESFTGCVSRAGDAKEAQPQYLWERPALAVTVASLASARLI